MFSTIIEIIIAAFVIAGSVIEIVENGKSNEVYKKCNIALYALVIGLIVCIIILIPLKLGVKL